MGFCISNLNNEIARAQRTARTSFLQTYFTLYLQQPNQTSGITGGNPQMIGTIAKAAIATGVDGLFIETHPNPAVAKSDGANMLHLDYFEDLKELIREKIKN